MLKVLFHSASGILSVLCLVLVFVIMAYLWTYFIRKMNENPED